MIRRLAIGALYVREAGPKKERDDKQGPPAGTSRIFWTTVFQRSASLCAKVSSGFAPNSLLAALVKAPRKVNDPPRELQLDQGSRKLFGGKPTAQGELVGACGIVAEGVKHPLRQVAY